MGEASIRVMEHNIFLAYILFNKRGLANMLILTCPKMGVGIMFLALISDVTKERVLKEEMVSFAQQWDLIWDIKHNFHSFKSRLVSSTLNYRVTVYVF